MLSNGEFVMSAKAVKKWGVGMLEDMNASTGRAMAMGGMANREVFRPTFTSNGGSNSSQNNADTPSAPTVNNFHFHSKQDGTFSKQSAEQAARSMIGMQNRFALKTN